MIQLIPGIGRITLPNCGRDDLPEFFVRQGYKVGAEIGVYLGDFSKQFLDAGLALNSVDAWTVYDGYRHPRGQARLDQQYQAVCEKLLPYPKANIIRRFSMDAVAEFPDDSLDFVYIDANHSFRYIAEDLVEWSRKVRPGGAISGHDYAHFGLRWHLQVREVVDAYTAAMHISPWYVLGRSRPRAGEIRDRFRSYLWIKQ